MSLFVVKRLDEVSENVRAGPHKVVLCTGTDVSSWWGDCQLTYCLVRLFVVVDRSCVCSRTLVVSDGVYGLVPLISRKDLSRSKRHLQGENVWTKASEMERC